LRQAQQVPSLLSTRKKLLSGLTREEQFFALLSITSKN
jgi:hypothetical protein